MRPKIHTCSCGTAFEFRVELAVHREATGHAPVQVEEAPAPAPPAAEPEVAAEPEPAEPEPVEVAGMEPPAPRRLSLARPLAALALVCMLYAFNCLMEKTVSNYTEVRNSATLEWATR